MVNVMLEDLTHRCFLSRDMNGVKACIDTIMQCTLDFRAHLSTASQEGDSNSTNLINDNLFVKAWFLIFLMLLCLDLNSILLSRNLESAWSFFMDSCACQHWVTSRNCLWMGKGGVLQTTVSNKWLSRNLEAHDFLDESCMQFLERSSNWTNASVSVFLCFCWP
jgi:hypothetical protein